MTEGPRGTAARRAAFARGRTAERRAVWLLRLKGFRILETGFRAAAGEIDIVARRGRLTVFAEVKARASREAALDAISPRQRRRIRRAAEDFLARQKRAAGPTNVIPGGGGVRFDVILVLPGRWPIHIADAWR